MRNPGTVPLSAWMAVLAALFVPTAALAAPEVDTGDTAWVLTSSALVLLMTPGLALFYGGMVRQKNVLSTLMLSFVAMGVMTVQWTVIGYSLAFAEGNSFIGGLDFLFLNGVGNEPTEGSTIPHSVFMIFQGMFAIITPALIGGAVAERMKFSAYVLFIVLWGTLVYDPVCHWVWGPGGWLLEMDALDFAGGTVVHISSGVSALALVMILGRRIGYPTQPMKPHSLGMTLLGAGLLWFGWFGFNGGSALGANASAANAFVVTHICAGTGAVAWMIAEWIHHGKPSALGFASGAVAGLVGITPACGFVSVSGALIIGATVGVVCYGGVMLKSSLGYDDSLDAFGVHGIGGTWGALMTGVLASSAIGGTAGMVESGEFGQVWVQFVSVVATFGYAFVVTWVLAKVLDLTIGLRVSEDDERTGLDLSQHGEVGYDI